MMTKETLHIYTRVSTTSQEEKGTSLEHQKELGRRKSKELGFKHKIWNEGGRSSHFEDLSNRPVIQDLLEEIESGSLKHLWVYSNDRLSRNEITAAQIRIQLKKHDVTLYTNDGVYNLSSPSDDFQKKILDAVAEYDNALRIRRFRFGKLNRARQGFWHGGPPPYGYEIKDKRLAKEKSESQWIKKIFRRYAKGDSFEILFPFLVCKIPGFIHLLAKPNHPIDPIFLILHC